jgi:hypothetical protein
MRFRAFTVPCALAVSCMLAITACSDDGGRPTIIAADGGAAVSSTLPPFTAAEPSTADAEEQIRLAFANFANAKVTQAERNAAVEDGDNISPERTARWEQLKGSASGVAFVVDDIRLVSATQADVDFHMVSVSAPSAGASKIIHGAAIVQGGRWRVSKATTCALATSAGLTCLD